MKKLIIILSLFVCVNALDQISIPFNFGPGDTLTAAKYNANHDTTAFYLNRVVDTVNRNVPRYTQNVYTHDLIMPFLRLDTLRSNTNIDSISGYPFFDSINVGFAKINVCSLSNILGSFSTDTINAIVVSSDSFYSKKGYSDTLFSDTALINNLTVDKNVVADSGFFTGISIDSVPLYYTRGIFLCSLFMDDGYQNRDSAYYQRVGSFVDIKLKGNTVELLNAANGFFGMGGFPESILPNEGDTVYIPKSYAAFKVIDSTEEVTSGLCFHRDTTGYAWQTAQFIMNHIFKVGNGGTATSGWQGDMFLHYKVDE